MAVTSSVGLFSGLDTADIISKLMAVEQRRLTTLQQRKSDYEKQISAYGDLLSKISALRDSLDSLRVTSFSSYKATSSNEGVIAATATNAASASQYQIVVSATAQAHSIYSKTFASESETVGTGTLSIQLGSGSPVNITIDSSNNTVSGIRDAINNAGAGVTAATINDGTGYRLIVSSNNSGASNVIKITVSDNDGNNTDNNGLSSLAYEKTVLENMTESQAPRNAQLTVNGLTVTRSTNTISDLITGVTINLKNNSSGQTVNLNIEKDTAAMKEKINTFIAAYNNVVEKAKELSGEKGTLSSDSTVDSIMSTLRAITLNTYSGSMLVNFGITHDKNGLLQVSDTELTFAMNNNMDALMDSMNSMVVSFDGELSNIATSIIPSRQDALEQRIDRIESDEDREKYRLEKVEEALVRKFAMLEQTISQLQSTGNSLSSQLSNILKISGGK